MILGNLGKDPELQHTQSGKAYASISVATNEAWKDQKGQRQERAEWHKVIAWGDLAENAANYLAKGRSVYIEGRLQTRSWEDKKTGEKRFTTEIVADRIVFLGGGDGGKREERRESRGVGRQEELPAADDDLPF